MRDSCALRQSGLVPSGCHGDGVVAMYHRPSLFILPRKMLGRREGVQHATLRQLVKLCTAVGVAVVIRIWITTGDSRLCSYCYLPLGPEWLVSFATTCQARQICFFPLLGSCVRCQLGIFVYTVITVGWLVSARELKLPLTCCLETYPFCLSGFWEEENFSFLSYDELRQTFVQYQPFAVFSLLSCFVLFLFYDAAVCYWDCSELKTMYSKML